ncbi:basic amino acid ABC transporter substrate-binding protein [Metallumcola ferriviriculae]|uniref:Basic amino acid ABC transporter substrate-binding protein n=1 Tax=Metallumcola ferriviriculae TaxID=3039180 RepID=A0AAU0UIP6_9FIRM|nr:basic amino acid ABC transporter substrate-binding protein [Desulfitibacteraceae bacterium MK1]
MKKYTKLVLLAMLALGLIVFAAGCGGEKAAEGDKVIVGTEAAYAPFEWQEDGEILGFDAEIIQAIVKEMGAELEHNHVAWDALYPSLNNGSIEAVISAMTITEEREEEVDFSDPYFEAMQIIALPDGSTIAGLEDLVGKKVGVQANTTGQYALEELDGMKDGDIQKYPTTPDAMMALATGELAAVVADSPVVLNYIKTNPEANLKTVTDDFDKEYYGIAVKQGNTELLEKINAALSTIKENGKYDEIYNKYFGE